MSNKPCKKSQRRLIKLLTENRFVRVNGKFAVEVDVRIISATSKDIIENRKKLLVKIYFLD